MEYEKFSVAMSVYGKDNAEYFNRALESVVLQTCKPSEIVLVVDGPVNGDIDKVIAQYAESEGNVFRVVRLGKNGGLGNALKVAVEYCTFEWIARMDSDDVALSTRFEEQLAFVANNPDVDIVGGDITEFIDEEGNIVGKRTVPVDHGDIVKYMKRRCPFNHDTVMFKKSVVQKSGGYLDWFCNEDYYLWIRMYQHGAKFANTGTTLVNMRVGNDMYSRRGGKAYFKSEAALQKYMFKQGIIGRWTYTINIVKRWIVQCLLPNELRGWVYKKFLRK